jgi:pilus assembly protein CpaC
MFRLERSNMTMTKISRTMLGTAVAALVAASFAAAAPAPALAQPTSRPANDVALSVGTGRLVRLDGNMSDLFVADPNIADVQVRSSNQLYIFGKGAGETTVYATNSAGRVVYSANVRVGTNMGAIDEMLRMAMPQSQIQVTPMSGFVLLTGTVAAPADVEDATRLTQALVGTGTQVISRLKTATPLQVMLQVKIAEVSRSIAKNIGVNLLTRDKTSGFLFGIGRGNAGTITDRLSATDLDANGNPEVVGTNYTFNNKVGATTLGFAGKLLGVDILSTLDLAENSGLVTTLAEPNLVALSGETASFLAGGEFPIPVSNGINGTSIEYKEYGVSLSFTPTVLEGGRISMRVRPEVSDLSSAGSVKTNGFEVPSLTTRRVETTVELGSGQSFVIGGLLQNGGNNSVERAPFLGNLPILGALFRSNSFRRNETELVIVVTPYLVRPVNAAQIALPTDGFRSANDPERLLLDKQHSSRSGETRPGPVMAPPQIVAPGLTTGSVNPAPPAGTSAPQSAARAPVAAPKPGFGF